MVDRFMQPIFWFVLGAIGIMTALIVAWALAPSATLSSDRTVQSAEEGGVTITSTWLGGSSNGLSVFHVLIDTHTVDLTEWDVGAIRLETAEGERIEPLRDPVVASRTSHHIDLVVEFPETESPATFVVKDLGGVPERRLPFP